MQVCRWLAFATSLLLVTVAATHSASAEAVELNFRPVALSGPGWPAEYGPNLGFESEFDSFLNVFALILPGPPSINQHGDVAFRAVASNPTRSAPMGIWTNYGGALHAVAYGGDSPFHPNLGPGVWFGHFFDPLINDQGAVAIGASLFGPNVSALNREGVWSANSVNMTPIASVEPQTQNPLIGLPSHVRYLPFTVAQNNASEVAFLGTLIDYGATDDSEFALFTNVGGPLRIVAREGDDVPQLGPGVQFDDVRVGPELVINPAIADNGTIVFHAPLRGTGINNSNRNALWLDRGNGLELIARSGPTGPGPQLGNLPFSIFESFTMNAHDDVAFLARLADPNAPFGYSAGIWVKQSNSTALELQARTGVAGLTANLDPAVSFVEISPPVLNSNRAVAFRGLANGPGINASAANGIWTNGSGELRAIALGHTTDPALGPGIGDEIYFAFISTPAINGAGDILFSAALGGHGTANDQSAWLWSRGQLRMLFREGDLFDVNPDPNVSDLHQIASFYLGTGSGGEDGRRFGLNDRGEFAFSMSFQDGLSGIFIGRLVPEPATNGLALVALTLLAARRNARKVKVTCE